MPLDEEIRLDETFEMMMQILFKKIGKKFDRWYDLKWYQKGL